MQAFTTRLICTGMPSLSHWFKPWALLILVCLLATMLLSACAPSPHTPKASTTPSTMGKIVPPAPHPLASTPVAPTISATLTAPEVAEQGKASWYGPGFHGRTTASGEPFDQYALTAAHPSYAFGTRLCVRSASSGQMVAVRVNDRGPFTGNRIIDLSQAAAQAIGMLDAGIKPVEIYKLSGGQKTCPASLG